MIGFVMVTSAGLSVDSARGTTIEGVLTSRTTIYGVLALIALAMGSMIDVGRWFQPKRTGLLSIGPLRFRDVVFHPAIWLMIASVLLLVLVHIPGIGATKNGAARWIEIRLSSSFALSMQPSEVAKWSMVILLPVFAAWVGADRIRRFWSGFVPLLAVLGLICGLIITEDLGTAVLIGLVGMMVLFAAGVRWWHIAILLPIPSAGIVAAIVTSPYRIERVRAFLNPYADPQGEGYHMIQSMAAIANGHLTGRGLGHGVYKFGYLPEDTTDFLFSIVCEELGIAGAVLVIFLYVALLISGIQILKGLPARGTKLIALGIVLTIGFQAAINLMVVTGMAPTKGIALPLLSAGGTGWILTAFSLGLLIGMDRGAEQERKASVDPDSVIMMPDDGEDERLGENSLPGLVAGG